MRTDSGRKIFKVMMPNDQPGMLHHQPRPRHPRIAIGVDKIDSVADKNVLIIGAPRAQDERGKKSELDDVQSPRPARRSKSAFANRKSKISLGPPGFEPGTKGL